MNNRLNKPFYVRPTIQNLTHPVQTFKFIINSAPIAELSEEIKSWVVRNIPGGIVYGLPRMGKTQAIIQVADDLKEMFGNDLPIIQFGFDAHDIITENAFYHERLMNINHYEAFKGNGTRKKQVLLNYLAEASLKHPTRRIVIFLDEAQNMLIKELKILVGIHNFLQKERAIPTFVLVGQPELGNKRNSLITSDNTQIIGRFMVNIHKFRGLKNVNEIKTCLEQFDEFEYPVNSGWPYTRYYFPLAFANGWRLADQSDLVLKAFQEITKTHGTAADKNGILMQYFISSVCTFLTENSKEDSINMNLSINLWKESILSSGYHIATNFIRIDNDSVLQ